MLKFTSEQLLNSHYFNASSVFKGIKKEIYSPEMIAKYRLCKRLLFNNPLFVFTRFLPLKSKTFIDAIDSFHNLKKTPESRTLP